ncbi:hypothetical protein Tco_1255865 [Tanacetum coccineum]
MGVYSVQRESRPMWNNVDNIPPFIPQAAHGRFGNVTFPAGSVNMPAPIPAGRQTGPAPVYAGTPVPAGRQNRPAPISAGRKIGPAPIYAGTPNPASRQNRPAPVHADRPFLAGRRNSVSVSAGWRNSAARPMEDRELLLSPRQVVLGKTVDHICKGDPRTMVDLNNLHGLTLIDPLGRLKKNLIQVLKIHTDENVADLLTKAFDGPRIQLFGGPHWDAQSLNASHMRVVSQFSSVRHEQCGFILMMKNSFWLVTWMSLVMHEFLLVAALLVLLVNPSTGSLLVHTG